MMDPQGLIRSIIRADCPERAHAALAILGGVTLSASLVVAVLAVWWQAVMDHEVSAGLVAVVATLSGAVAGLAGYLKAKSSTPTSEGAPQ